MPFMLCGAKLCQLDTWLLSVPVRTSSIPEHSCYVGLFQCCDETLIVATGQHKNAQKAKLKLYPREHTIICLRTCSTCDGQRSPEVVNRGPCAKQVTVKLVGVKITPRVNLVFKWLGVNRARSVWDQNGEFEGKQDLLVHLRALVVLGSYCLHLDNPGM